MKKFLAIITLAATVLSAGNYASAQNSAALKKALKKEYKTKMREYKKGGWTLHGSSRSLDVVLLMHYEELAKPNIREITGVASRISSLSVGHQATINDACRTYAQSAASQVKGRIVSDLGADGENTAAEFDHFYAAYERNVETEIRGELVESFTIKREIAKDAKGQPVYEMHTYFRVDEEAACSARIRAYENALKVSEAAQKYAEKVSKFVNEGVTVNSEK